MAMDASPRDLLSDKVQCSEINTLKMGLLGRPLPEKGPVIAGGIRESPSDEGVQSWGEVEVPKRVNPMHNQSILDEDMPWDECGEIEQLNEDSPLQKQEKEPKDIEPPVPVPVPVPAPVPVSPEGGTRDTELKNVMESSEITGVTASMSCSSVEASTLTNDETQPSAEAKAALMRVSDEDTCPENPELYGLKGAETTPRSEGAAETTPFDQGEESTIESVQDHDQAPKEDAEESTIESVQDHDQASKEDAKRTIENSPEEIDDIEEGICCNPTKDIDGINEGGGSCNDDVSSGQDCCNPTGNRSIVLEFEPEQLSRLMPTWRPDNLCYEMVVADDEVSKLSSLSGRRGKKPASDPSTEKQGRKEKPPQDICNPLGLMTLFCEDVKFLVTEAADGFRNCGNMEEKPIPETVISPSMQSL